MKIVLLALIFSLSWGAEAFYLTPQSAYKMALDNNPAIKRALLELDSLEARERETKAFFLPNVFLGAGLIYNSKTDLWERPFGVALVSTLYEYRKTLPRIKSAEIRSQLKRHVIKQMENELKVRILELFAEADLNRKLTEVKREETAIAFVRFDRAVQRKELGLTTELEILRLESVYKEKRKELRQAQYEYNKTVYKIKELVGLRMDSVLELAEISFTPKVGVLDKDKMMNLALENNTQLAIKRLKLRLYEQIMEEANKFFDLRVQLRLEVGNTIRGGFPQTRAYNQSGWRGGIELLVPLFDPSTPFNLISFANEKRALEAEIEPLLRDLESTINAADYKYAYLLSKFESAISRDKYAEENLALRRSEYELELAFDLGYAMAEKSEAERQVMHAKYETMIFLAQLYSLIGIDPFLVLGGDHEFFRLD